MRTFRPRRPRLWAFGIYLLLSLAATGWRWLPHPSTSCACQGTDPDIFLWSLAWWPHALLHGLNPFYSNFDWYPVGVNLGKLTSVPTLAIALSPVTELLGPQVSYNLVTLASPTLAAFTAYLLCRRLARRELPALAGGFLFGFGAYQFPQLVGHPNLALVFLIPLMVITALRRAEGEISRRRYVLLMALLLILQLGISTEVLATAVLMGFTMLLAALILVPVKRAQVRNLIDETILSGCLTAVVASPFLYYALVKGGVPSEAIGEGYGLDLLNPFLPTLATWIGGSALHSVTTTFEGGAFAEANGYLSIPIVLAFVLWTVTSWRHYRTRLVVIAAAVSFVAALGGHLHVAGHETIPLPFNLIKNLPVIKLFTPSRIAMYTSLAVAVGVSLWLSEAKARSRGAIGRWLLVGLGMLLVLPDLGGELWGAPPAPPAFFRNGAYRHYLKSGEVALALPFAQNGISTGWQAECGFCFRMPGAYLGHGGPSQVTGLPIVNELGSYRTPNPGLLLKFLVSDHIRDVIVEDQPLPMAVYSSELSNLGFKGVSVGGVVVYHVPSP